MNATPKNRIKSNQIKWNLPLLTLTYQSLNTWCDWRFLLTNGQFQPEICVEVWVEVSVAASCCRPCWGHTWPQLSVRTLASWPSVEHFSHTHLHFWHIIHWDRVLLSNLSLVKFVWRSCCNWYQNLLGKWAKTFNSFSTPKKTFKAKDFLSHFMKEILHSLHTHKFIPFLLTRAHRKK